MASVLFTPSWVRRSATTPSQLGVNSTDAAVSGNLAGELHFFGALQSEVISIANSQDGGWDRDRAQAIISTDSWPRRGGDSPVHVQAGIIAFAANSGLSTYHTSHRTILSGY